MRLMVSFHLWRRRCAGRARRGNAGEGGKEGGGREGVGEEVSGGAEEEVRGNIVVGGKRGREAGKEGRRCSSLKGGSGG